ncbi:hypothetical protein [Streptomyces sp. NPDC026673]|uniref:hypothetical protein n=1 Tax=Streptomyces sp. NPDC026673 TaxID=3155724 RepID=UPI0033C2D69D
MSAFTAQPRITGPIAHRGAVERNVTVRVDAALGRRLITIEVSASDRVLTRSDISFFQALRDDDAPYHDVRLPDGETLRVSYAAGHAIGEFVRQIQHAEYGELGAPSFRALRDLLYSDETRVPMFNSPPSDWLPLRTVLEQASAIGVGVTFGGPQGVVAMVGAYVGGIFLVKFFTPIVAAAGDATAAAVNAKIRTAFGLEAQTAVPVQPDPTGDSATLPASSEGAEGEAPGQPGGGGSQQ